MAESDEGLNGTMSMRRRAKPIAAGFEARSPVAIPEGMSVEPRQILHELRVHQIELEMQNEELRRRQVELEDARARYFDLYDLAPVGYCTLSDQGLILEANLAAATLLGSSRDALVMQPISRFFLTEDQDRYYLHRKQVAAPDAQMTIELGIVRQSDKEGTATAAPLWVQLTTTVEQAPDGTPIYRLVLNNITRRKQAEAALLILNKSLETRILVRTAELSDSQQAVHSLSALMVSKQEDERSRVARELHDSIGSALSAVKFMVEGSLITPCPAGRNCHLNALRKVIPIIQNSVEELRRICMALRPQTLDDLGLIVTIDWFLRGFQEAHNKLQVKKQIDLAEAEIEDQLKIALFRIVQEGVNNAAKHSRATHLCVRLWRDEEQLVLEIEDDGVGFDPTQLLTSGVNGGFGLSAMRHRAKLSGGEFAILAAPAKGTRIRACWPRTLSPVSLTTPSHG